MILFVPLVVFILNQVDMHNARNCSPVAISEEPCNITRKVSIGQGSIVWRRDGDFILLSNHPCTSAPTNGNYSGYCFDDSLNRFYILEILHPEYHDQSNFTDSLINVKTSIDLMVPDDLSSSDFTLQIPRGISGNSLFVSISIACCKPQPNVKWILLVLDSNKVYVFENSTMLSDASCSPLLLKWNSSLTVDLNALDPQITKQNKDINITVEVEFGPYRSIPSVPVTVAAIGPPSTPPTPSASTSLQPTSSAQNPSTKVSSESSTSTTPTPTPKCEDLICVCDQICIIIICVCVGSLIIIVVIILCCCCCPFCPCYKRRKKKSEGTECKCCGLICVCCRPNNKDHDEESEGRAKVCESCCCLFCVCYKRKKKSGDRNSNPNKKKSASRSQQYEMPRTNHPDGMHSYSGYQVNRPDERARVYQPADMNYHVRRPDQQARVYQPSPATGFTPHDSRYGQGYNNAAYMHHGENERRNMDRKSRVTQRPYTKHY